jgi:hypothetical protein
MEITVHDTGKVKYPFHKGDYKKRLHSILKSVDDDTPATFNRIATDYIEDIEVYNLVNDEDNEGLLLANLFNTGLIKITEEGTDGTLVTLKSNTLGTKHNYSRDTNVYVVDFEGVDHPIGQTIQKAQQDVLFLLTNKGLWHKQYLSDTLTPIISTHSKDVEKAEPLVFMEIPKDYMDSFNEYFTIFNMDEIDSRDVETLIMSLYKAGMSDMLDYLMVDDFPTFETKMRHAIKQTQRHISMISEKRVALYEDIKFAKAMTYIKNEIPKSAAVIKEIIKIGINRVSELENALSKDNMDLIRKHLTAKIITSDMSDIAEDLVDYRQSVGTPDERDILNEVLERTEFDSESHRYLFNGTPVLCEHHTKNIGLEGNNLLKFVERYQGEMEDHLVYCKYCGENIHSFADEEDLMSWDDNQAAKLANQVLRNDPKYRTQESIMYNGVSTIMREFKTKEAIDMIKMTKRVSNFVSPMVFQYIQSRGKLISEESKYDMIKIISMMYTVVYMLDIYITTDTFYLERVKKKQSGPYMLYFIKFITTKTTRTIPKEQLHLIAKIAHNDLKNTYRQEIEETEDIDPVAQVLEMSQYSLLYNIYMKSRVKDGKKVQSPEEAIKVITGIEPSKLTIDNFMDKTKAPPGASDEDKHLIDLITKSELQPIKLKARRRGILQDYHKTFTMCNSLRAYTRYLFSTIHYYNEDGSPRKWTNVADKNGIRHMISEGISIEKLKGDSKKVYEAMLKYVGIDKIKW